ncbi:hypothetical protein Ciccas_011380 [Cichlidogyrus casuarinus]|uniref:Uncharacterized protein n=1 Tax=Cichlidogyrus casuarinus TaxID=1844966 RepID=A0ABD2PUC2_9PLAT
MPEQRASNNKQCRTSVTNESDNSPAASTCSSSRPSLSSNLHRSVNYPKLAESRFALVQFLQEIDLVKLLDNVSDEYTIDDLIACWETDELNQICSNGPDPFTQNEINTLYNSLYDRIKLSSSKNLVNLSDKAKNLSLSGSVELSSCSLTCSASRLDEDRDISLGGFVCSSPIRKNSLSDVNSLVSFNKPATKLSSDDFRSLSAEPHNKTPLVPNQNLVFSCNHSPSPLASDPSRQRYTPSTHSHSLCADTFEDTQQPQVRDVNRMRSNTSLDLLSSSTASLFRIKSPSPRSSLFPELEIKQSLGPESLNRSISGRPPQSHGSGAHFIGARAKDSIHRGSLGGSFSNRSARHSLFIASAMSPVRGLSNRSLLAPTLGNKYDPKIFHPRVLNYSLFSKRNMTIDYDECCTIS